MEVPPDMPELNSDQVDSSAHVHFPEEQIEQHDSGIVVSRTSADCLSLQLGFLQIHHFYEITVLIPDELDEELTSDPLQNHHVKVKHIKPSDDGKGHEIVFDFNAAKEKLMREEIVVSEVHGDKKLTIVLNARVLGKGKGTPALKTGIHCSGMDPEYDSEQSDWQGFD